MRTTTHDRHEYRVFTTFSFLQPPPPAKRTFKRTQIYAQHSTILPPPLSVESLYLQGYGILEVGENLYLVICVDQLGHWALELLVVQLRPKQLETTRDGRDDRRLESFSTHHNGTERRKRKTTENDFVGSIHTITDYNTFCYSLFLFIQLLAFISRGEMLKADPDERMDDLI